MLFTLKSNLGRIFLQESYMVTYVPDGYDPAQNSSSSEQNNEISQNADRRRRKRQAGSGIPGEDPNCPEKNERGEYVGCCVYEATGDHCTFRLPEWVDTATIRVYGIAENGTEVHTKEEIIVNTPASPCGAFYSGFYPRVIHCPQLCEMKVLFHSLTQTSRDHESANKTKQETGRIQTDKMPPEVRNLGPNPHRTQDATRNATQANGTC